LTPRLAVNSQTHLHLLGGHRKQRLGLAGEGAAVEGHAVGKGGVVCLAHHSLDRVEVLACLRGRASHLVDHDCTGDAAALIGPFRRSGRYVVRDIDDPGVDPFSLKPLCGSPEIQTVSRIIAERKHDARPA